MTEGKGVRGGHFEVGGGEGGKGGNRLFTVGWAKRLSGQMYEIGAGWETEFPSLSKIPGSSRKAVAFWGARQVVAAFSVSFLVASSSAGGAA